MSDWRDEARCLGLEDLFLPEEPTPAGIAEAKAICATCPVLAECKLDAQRPMQAFDDEGKTYEVPLYGIFGGKFYAPGIDGQGADRVMTARFERESLAPRVIDLWHSGVQDKTEIGKRVGVSRTTVRKILKENGVAA